MRTLITGASRGLGAALVDAFLPHGEVLGIARQLNREATGFRPVQADLTTEDGLETVLAAVGETPLGTIVHNAGILGARAPIADYPEADWDRVLEINLTAPFRLTRRLLPRMARGGCILFVSSGAGRRAAPEWGAYAVSKFGIDGLALLLAEEVREAGIRVHSINPGGMRTAMRAAAYPQEDPARVPDPAQISPFFVEVARAAAGTFPVLLDAKR